MYNVYIVDDEHLMIESLVEAIQWQENDFALVGKNTDAESALEEISTLRPDLVFCDLKMPGLSGTALIRACRARGIDSEFIMLSAFAEFHASRDFFLQGGFDYLLKPIDADGLQMTLDGVSKRLILKKPPTYIETGADTGDIFDKMLGYLEGNLDKKHSLKSLSTTFFLSENYISNLFAKKLHTTFTVYMANLRMEKAMSLVCDTNQSMKQIGASCGYGDYFYFCRVFKNHFGRAPGEYRQERRG